MTNSLRIIDPFEDFRGDQEVEVILPAAGVSFVPGPQTRIESGPAEIIRLYPAVPATELTVLQGPRRPPCCDCPRAVRADGSILVWHQPRCDEVRTEDLAAIL